MINRDLNSNAYVVNYSAIETPVIDEDTNQQKIDEKTGKPIFNYSAVTESTEVSDAKNIVKKEVTIIEPHSFKKGDNVNIIDIDKKGTFIYLSKPRERVVRKEAENSNKTEIVQAQITKIKENEIEIPATIEEARN
jgi:POT family proton-dependent oligopeptide transporter